MKFLPVNAGISFLKKPYFKNVNGFFKSDFKYYAASYFRHAPKINPATAKLTMLYPPLIHDKA